MTLAIVREPSASLAACQLSFVPREAIDLTLARSQHAAYTAALREAGCRVLELPAEDALPDAVFVEDVALVLDELAVMTRPGAPSRRAEGAAVAAAFVVPSMASGNNALNLQHTMAYSISTTATTNAPPASPHRPRYANTTAATQESTESHTARHPTSGFANLSPGPCEPSPRPRAGSSFSTDRPSSGRHSHNERLCFG